MKRQAAFVSTTFWHHICKALFIYSKGLKGPPVLPLGESDQGTRQGLGIRPPIFQSSVDEPL